MFRTRERVFAGVKEQGRVVGHSQKKIFDFNAVFKGVRRGLGRRPSKKHDLEYVLSVFSSSSKIIYKLLSYSSIFLFILFHPHLDSLGRGGGAASTLHLATLLSLLYFYK